jgi:hypothetical protein
VVVWSPSPDAVGIALQAQQPDDILSITSRAILHDS